MDKWDQAAIDTAHAWRKLSKDPSSQIGAVIVNPDRLIVSTGYNDFPRGIANDAARWERPAKYKWVEHAERNAIYNAARLGVSVKGCTMYLVGFGPPTVPCINCSKAVIQSGITEVRGWPYKKASEDWASDLAFAYDMLTEAGVKLIEL